MRRVIITILLVNTLFLQAKEKEVETRTATVTVPFDRNDKLTLNMKNTEVRLETWDRDEVYIEATVRLNGSVTNKRAEFLDNWQEIVESGVSSSSFGVKVNSALETTKEVNKKTFLGMVVSMTITTDNSYDITYSIKAPGKAGLKIDGSYKDVSLVGYFNRLEMDLYSADFKADSLLMADLELKYGNARISKISKAEITLYENELEAEEITSLELSTKYSEVEIKKLIELVNLDSYETDFVIGYTKGLEGIIKYGELELTEGSKKVDLELYEVDLELGEIEEIKMRSKYSNLKADRIENLILESSYEDEFEVQVLGSMESTETKYGVYDIRELTGSFKLEGYEDNISIYAISSNASEISLSGKYVETEINVADNPIVLDIYTTYGDISFDESKFEVSRMITESSKKEIKAKSKATGENGLKIMITGYEMDLDID